MLPSITRQREFSLVASRIAALRDTYEQNIVDFESLYSALNEKIFKGELDLSRVPLPGTQIEEEITVAAEPLQIPAEQGLAIHLPDTDNLSDALKSSEARQRLLSRWLEAYRSQLGNTPFSAQHFRAVTQDWLAERYPDNDFELGVNDYEHIKAWVFEALAAGTLTQVLDEAGNRIELKAARA